MGLFRRRRRRRSRNDRGESLIEVLVTIVIIGISVPAIMGAVLLSVSVSSQDRRQIEAQALLASWVETIARENKTDAAYSSCVGLSYYATSPYAPAAVPTGFTTSVVAINYWDTATGSYVTTCPAVDSGAATRPAQGLSGSRALPGVRPHAVGRGSKAVPRMLTQIRDDDLDDDEGFTLVEMLVTITVVGIIMVALVAVMFGSMKSNIDTKVRLDETRDQQFAASYFGPDASAATSVLRGVTAGCGPGTAAIEFRGTSYDAVTLAETVTVVSYIFGIATVDGKPAGQLRRQACETAASPVPAYPLVIKSSQLVARNLVTAAPMFACTPAPPAVCGSATTSVTLTASRRSGDAPFLLVGTRRTTA